MHQTLIVFISTAAVGFELKFGNIEYLLYNNTVVKVAEAVFSYFTKVGIAMTKATVDNKIRRHNTDIKNFLRLITRSWHLVAPYLDKVFFSNTAGNKRPFQDSPERTSMVKKLRPEGDVEATEGPVVKVIFGGSSAKQIGYTQTMFIFKQCMMLTSFGCWLTFANTQMTSRNLFVICIVYKFKYNR
ncbi:hypothetical protein BgiBS90_034139 [Biomphalaria glabrata]|nr:hypothetical protein BgiBS90_034139 [Biomphalaria glabrata]